MYKVISLLSWIIRQFLMPNPFTPIGPQAELYNWAAGASLLGLSYIQVSLVYESGSNPVAGSLYFLLAYIVNSAMVYLIMLFYPMEWIMLAIAIVYLVASFGILSLCGRRRFF